MEDDKMRHEKVDVIFKAAIQVFAEYGFDQAKMDDIAQVAGVAKGTIYYHFRSKDELFVGLMSEGLDKLIDCARRNIEQYGSAMERLNALIHAHIDFFVQNTQLAKLLLNEAFGNKERQYQFRVRIREYVQLIESVLIEGKESGEFVVDYPHAMASAIFGAASVIVLERIYHYEENVEKEIEKIKPQLVETVRQLLFNSLVKNGK
jgi:AcrR family transcriptional regulator